MSDSLPVVASAFLGVGWQFPVEAPDHTIDVAAYEDSIQQSIEIVLGTAPGERVMRPDFGCGIHELVFAPLDTTTAGTVSTEVRDALLRWEPRIEVISIDVGPAQDEPVTLVIRIEYRVRATNNVFNLVYPFYLDRTGA